MRWVLGFLLLMLVLILFAETANGQTSQCDARVNVLKHLKDRYGEEPVAVGVTQAGRMLEVIAARDGGTWTIIVTSPIGMSCLLAAGEGWRNLGLEDLDPPA